MLASLRNGLRHANIPSPRVLSFSSTAVSRQTFGQEPEFEALQDMISIAGAEKAEKDLAAGGRKSFAGDLEASSIGGRRGNFKTFNINSAIRPHELTYQSRVVKLPIRRRRVEVAPEPKVARYNDVFHQLGINPLVFAQNPVILNEYMSEMGKIYSRSVTGLTAKTQRKLGQAIRRAKMMGVTPVLSSHERAGKAAKEGRSR